MSALTELPNIGNEVERQLHEIGITSEEQLKSLGSRQAWLDIQKIDSSACYNRLCGLEGAIQGIRWHFLSDSVKKDLKAFYLEHKIER